MFCPEGPQMARSRSSNPSSEPIDTNGVSVRRRPVSSHLRRVLPGVHRLMIMRRPSILSAASALKRSGRAVTAVASLAMLLSLSSPVSAYFVCARGMAEAGPNCPMCHGDATPSPNSCCKLIVKSTLAASLSTVRMDDGRANDRLVSPVTVPAATPCGTEIMSRPFPFVDLERAGPSSIPSQTTALRL